MKVKHVPLLVVALAISYALWVALDWAAQHPRERAHLIAAAAGAFVGWLLIAIGRKCDDDSKPGPVGLRVWLAALLLAPERRRLDQAIREASEAESVALHDEEVKPSFFFAAEGCRQGLQVARATLFRGETRHSYPTWRVHEEVRQLSERAHERGGQGR